MVSHTDIYTDFRGKVLCIYVYVKEQLLIVIFIVIVYARTRTGFANSFCAFRSWEGEGPNEIGKDKSNGKVVVKVNPKFYRPTEVVSYSMSL